MDDLISIFNKLQGTCSTIGVEVLQLPQIVVVGAQSSGKSSVLENLVGKSFLPRGVGIVTRRPLVLQLCNAPDNSSETCVFSHRTDTFTDFNEVMLEIERDTSRVAGTNKGVSEEPIHLRIYSPKVVNLTLVDLPGLTKVPVGEQPTDIDNIIRTLVLRYIRNPNALILAIVTANTDIATSESLQLAKQCDPNGERTLAVLTKLDLMDSGTDAVEILRGHVVPVQLGIVGVVNRSQQDIINNKPITSCLLDEEAFLQRRYPQLANKNGTKYLSRTLNKLLLGHIKKCLPELIVRVNSMKTETVSELAVLGAPPASDKTLLSVLTNFARGYCAALDGTLTNIETKELCGGARICFIFHETFGAAIESIPALCGLTRMDILTALRNSTGTKAALFVPEVCFEMLVKRQIIKLQAPSLRCIELIHQELSLSQITSHCGTEMTDEVNRFPKLLTAVANTLEDLIKRQIPQTRTMVETLFRMELAYINTMHPDFRKEVSEEVCAQEKQKDKLEDKREAHSSKNITMLVKTNNLPTNWISSFLSSNETLCRTPSKTCTLKRSSTELPSVASLPATRARLGSHRKLNETEDHECQLIEKLIKSYFEIVKKSIKDFVPKTIMMCLVNYVRDNLQRELIKTIYHQEASEDLLQESAEVVESRKQKNELLSLLENAEKILQEISSVA